MVEPNRTEAIVEFDYVAQESDELTLHKGDIITDIRMQPGGWWEGTLAGKRGMFPDNFVKVLNEPGSKKDPVTDGVPLRPASGRRCKVLFSYQPVNDDELALQVNDVIEVLGEVEEGWWKGKLRENVGVFPSNFVMEIKDQTVEENHSPAAMTSSQKSRSSSRDDASESDGELSTSVSSPDSSQLLDKSDHDPDAPILPPKPVKELCRVLFPYDAVNEDELTLKEGDLITLLSREVTDKGWWRGELRGKVGVFPDNFVEVVQQEEPKKPERPPAKSQTATSTNRIRDTITKPSVSPGSARTEPAEASVRKSLDLPPKPDEKSPSAVPPIPGKKPLLPPPIKKPQRMNHSAPLAEQRFMDAVDGAGSSRAARHSVNAHTSKDEVPEFDSVERSAMLIHPTASRAKAPRRRLPTNVYNKEPELSIGLMNGTADGGHHNDLDSHDHQPESGGGGPTRGRVWEKNKAPWVEELKLNQAKKTVPGTRSSLSPRSPTLLPTSPSAPLGHSPISTSTPIPSPKEKLQPDSGHSRLTSPQNTTSTPSSAASGDSVISTPSSEATPKQTPTGVTLRHHGPTRAQGLFGGDISRPQSRPFSMTGTGVSIDQPRPSSTEPPNVRTSPGLLKPSPVSPSSTANHTTVTTTTTTSQHRTISPSSFPVSSSASTKPDPLHGTPSSAPNQDIPALSPAASTTIPSPGGMVPQKQYLELKEKVAKLEQCLEEQKQCFTQALKEVVDKLNEEISRRMQIEQDLDKLTNLVTQV
ncbi:SH3 domain-containing kinase-binding protein 1 isoform X2 [Anabrus simplex]|uniref:SH3 domain-containing kinase-binding protein 1 isoform X2 n=1 Tax=Anabrus simplex TaxID=316456 RepID=UPI0035A30823